jgi:hypothetical protein
VLPQMIGHADCLALFRLVPMPRMNVVETVCVIRRLRRNYGSTFTWVQLTPLRRPRPVTNTALASELAFDRCIQKFTLARIIA